MTAPRRALILAGGGIRVAWQTGAVTALREFGLRFEHGDGSSGGIFTLGMMLSGQEPDEMGERWRHLDVKSFASVLPLRAYLRSPTNWVAFGGARGIRETVLPGLGIDLARVRAATEMSGSFNVADFGRKRCVPIPHTEIDEDRLIAGVSLAGVMPAVEHDGRTWTDAVWIKDANLTEAVERGCTELWVLWCIANTPRWGTGALEQYVHMIEMSASGALFAELDWIADVNARRRAGEAVFGGTEPVVVHLIKPRLPIPLDPDFLAGRIDAETLIAMGYRDACAYLDELPPDGIPLDEHSTATPARVLGARMTMRSTGRLTGFGEVACSVIVEADDLDALVRHPGTAFAAVGTWRDGTHGLRMFRRTVALLVGTGSERILRAKATMTLAGEFRELTIEILLPDGRLRSARRHRWTLCDRDGAVLANGVGRMSLRQSVRALISFEPAGAHDLRGRVRALRLAARAVRAPRTTEFDPVEEVSDDSRGE